MKSALKFVFGSVFATIFSFLTLGNSYADALLDKVQSGGAVRLGFANEIPWAYPGDNNEPLGFVHVAALGALKNMGIENIEPVVTDWGGLIPGLNANRYDIVTGGMYILGSRCENMNFSEPIGVFGDVFVVPAGNPKNSNNYEDIKNNPGTVMVTGVGYNIVEAAHDAGVPDSQIMQVPGPAEMLAALLAGRADAIGNNVMGGQHLVDQSGGKIELADPTAMPDKTKQGVGIGFRKSDTDFLAAFNTALAEFIGTEEHLTAAAEYNYGKHHLPDGTTTAHYCANR